MRLNKNALLIERVFCGGEDRIRISSPPWGHATEQKRAPYRARLCSGREDRIRISPPQWGHATEQKRAPHGTRLLWRGGQDSNLRLVLPSTHLAGEPIQPLWHLPVFDLKVSSCRCATS